MPEQPSTQRRFEELWAGRGYSTRIQNFQELMRFKVRDILLISSLYDSYILEEDGRLFELIQEEYRGLDMNQAPDIIHVSNGTEAIRMLDRQHRFDLILMTLHIEDIHAIALAKKIRSLGHEMPIIVLAYDNIETQEVMTHRDADIFENIFIWQGDYRLLIGIIKYIEDKMNFAHDSRAIGVQGIILVEDNVKFYSSYLPIIYTEIHRQSQRLISEGINLTHKFLRMRARPKILLCHTYEEAWKYYEEHNEYILGMISDVDFPRNGAVESKVGLLLARTIREKQSDIPILLQSTESSYSEEAREIGAAFVLKDSPVLLQELSDFMKQNFSFGDFVFRLEDGSEVGRASDLSSLEETLHSVPAESVQYHGERNHFSNWLKARTEFWLAHKLKPKKVTDYATVEDIRQHVIKVLKDYREIRQRANITDFSKDTFDPESSFARIGGGSLGGKARGLGFVKTLLNNYNMRYAFEGAKIFVPAAVAIGTNVFDQFLEHNNLRELALNSTDDREIADSFHSASYFPPEVITQLREFLEMVCVPLAVRSSSLLEDSQYHPFAGVYETYMIPNNHADTETRLQELLTTIKKVYASTFYKATKDYIKQTAYRLEEEKMAVIIMRTVGAAHDNRFYPDFSGVAKSYNFYPMPPQTAKDGIASIALGLGKTIVDGGNTVRFCPKYPKHLIQQFSTKEALKTSQTEFYAMKLGATEVDLYRDTKDRLIGKFTLDTAEKDGSLRFSGSTYSIENDAVYDGISRAGMRIVTFAPILKNKMFPLPEILDLLLELGKWGMGSEIEMEFAVNMSTPPGKPREFGVLQMRPLVLRLENDALDVTPYRREEMICESTQVLGNGVIDSIRDILVVDYDRFDRARSKEVALEIAQLNEKLVRDGKPYALIGVGRWGSLDHWLGIPVRWDQINGARAIIESSFRDFDVDPSQGSHFFQNITSFQVGYFTVPHHAASSFVDWAWLAAQKAEEELNFTRHLSFENPIVAVINGHDGKGVLLKPKPQPKESAVSL
ncbi:MAG TPA: PEP/pyruvate-binding domain-containing protein [bacterium]|nr:PEP/pyruvate-binding domain-containing protein [bacterium]HND77029.1 PEP/pyruvate-binding domain-containing protein [bacterium]HNE82779.1 PEP/pyruvate-binding domain-containing protein [bacterium]HNF85426.1 PEP/pyruvate-binding domain-containing protein [bacterium]HNH31145.1 PEP/pyruvate-binding domain-containing protein [bacterium]